MEMDIRPELAQNVATVLLRIYEYGKEQKMANVQFNNCV
jgi:hypothetical protein